ncbi:DUF5606 domain-containing protein [Marinoscillum sp. MHG1-6]|uniref:DUF5606 family protein n=1 Tax=Marinoscillum sp. MHG1-6 TaxID=2959627 RepID=UPI00215710BD|nr:DUF5606 domain-containing protein [Marinoscillum sp. MHG1-6]
MDFSEIASISGKGGLFRLVSPTRSGVILETLDEAKKKMVVSGQGKVSILSDISIYTTDEEGARPLKEVMGKIHAEFNGDTDLSSSSAPDELKSFLKFILPEYDEDRVYVSDIKKLVTWYNLLAQTCPEIFEGKKEDEKKSKA